MVDDGTTDIIINLKDVNFIDSSGLGIFVAIYKMLKPLDGSVSLVNLQKTVLRIFDLTGTRKVFRIFDTLDEALNNCTN
jgi:anti-sigma B factor antagonist